MFERPSQLDDPTFNHVESFLRSRGAVLVHCAGAPEDVERRLRERGDDKLGVAQVRPALKLFHAAVARSRLPVFNHSVECPVDVDALIRHARFRAVAASKVLTVERRVVGELEWASALVVGDRPADRPYPAPHTMPFVPYGGTSGHYLMRALPPRARWALVNSENVDLARLRAALRHPPVVALGNEAFARCADSGLRAGVVPHPQFVRRFHHSRVAEYGAAVRLAAATGGDLRDRFRPTN